MQAQGLLVSPRRDKIGQYETTKVYNTEEAYYDKGQRQEYSEFNLQKISIYIHNLSVYNFSIF